MVTLSYFNAESLREAKIREVEVPTLPLWT